MESALSCCVYEMRCINKAALHCLALPCLTFDEQEPDLLLGIGEDQHQPLQHVAAAQAQRQGGGMPGILTVPEGSMAAEDQSQVI